MALKNIKNRNGQSGFTIVELLIVIVVIAILAAISIVAYTGIQARARTSSGQQLASQVEKKAQAFYTVNSSYPADFSAFSGVPEAKLEGITTSNLNVVTTKPTTTTPAASTYADGKTVSYYQCGSGTGAMIGYWDFSASTPAAVLKTVGSGC